MTVLYPTAAIRGLIGETASDDSLSADAKVRELAALGEELRGLAAECDRRMTDARKLAEAEALVQSERMIQLRENADIREELIRRGFATEPQMDAAGYASHEAIDEFVADRYGLEESLVGALRAQWDELKHPRGRGGRFREIYGAKEVGSRDANGTVKRVLEDTQTGKRIKVYHGQPGVAPGGGPSQFEPRRLAQEERTQAAVARGSQRSHRLADPTNVLGRISQKALLQYLELTKTRPTTTDLHSTRDPASGERIWDEERAALHLRIAKAIISRRKDGKVCYECEQIPGHAEGDREAVFMGGGYAAGKGTVQDQLVLTGAGGMLHGARPPRYENGKMVDPGDKNQTFLALDPDEIKAELPEFQQAADDDPEANYNVYEEAWHVSQIVQELAMHKGIDVLVDGISDTSADEVAKRRQAFIDRGYKPPSFHYVSVPTDVAVERAIERARKATKRSDKRYIPEQVMRAVHRDVSATVPAILKDPRFRDSQVSVYNTEVKGEPRLMAQKVAGTVGETVADEGLWKDFLAKGEERIAGVKDDPAHAKYLEGLITPEEKAVSEHRPQAWGEDRASAATAVPALQAHMEDAMQAIASSIGAEVRGGPNPYDPEAIAAHDGKDVLIAPPKAMDEALKKVVRKLDGKWRHVSDLVRGSVVVPHEEDLDGAIKALRAEVVRRPGWQIVESENKFLHIPESPVDAGPPPTGYKDVSFQVMTPEGNHFELQFHVRSMWIAKELGGPETGGVPGHRLYKMGQRLMDEVRDRPATPEQKVELEQLVDLQQALYGRASDEGRRQA